MTVKTKPTNNHTGLKFVTSNANTSSTAVKINFTPSPTKKLWTTFLFALAPAWRNAMAANRALGITADNPPDKTPRPDCKLKFVIVTNDATSNTTNCVATIFPASCLPTAFNACVTMKTF